MKSYDNTFSRFEQIKWKKNTCCCDETGQKPTLFVPFLLIFELAERYETGRFREGSETQFPK